MSAAGGMARLLSRVWFRRLDLEGRLPEGPVLLLMNHPNGLLDALVPAALLEPPPRFVAKATLWNIWPLRPFLALFDPIPVKRPKDGDGSAEATARTFEAVHAALAAGRAVALFPEGISHGMADLAPLKTGAARMALSSPVPVAVVPAGLVYGDRRIFRSAALLRLGAPIPYGDLAPAGPEPEAVRELTGRIREALVPLTLHDPREADLRLAEALAELLAEGPKDRMDLERHRARVRTLLDRLEALPPRDRARLEAEAAEAQDWLARQGIRPDQVGHPYGPGEVAAWLPKALLRLALGLACLPFGLLFWPPYRLIGALANRLTDEADQTGTYKLLGGLLLLPLWAAALGAWAAHRWGAPGALGVLAAALLAFLSLALTERIREDLQALRGFLARKHPRVPALLEARKRLLAAFPGLEG